MGMPPPHNNVPHHHVNLFDDGVPVDENTHHPKKPAPPLAYGRAGVPPWQAQVALRQRLVTIRYMTFQELLADISGTWAICAGFGLCIALFGQVTLGWSWLGNELYQDPVRFAWLRALFGNSRRARDVKIVQRELLFAHAEPPNPKAQAEPPRAADSAPSSSTTKKKVAPDEPPGVDL